MKTNINTHQNAKQSTKLAVCIVSLCLLPGLLTGCSNSDDELTVFEDNIDLADLAVDDGERACRLFESRFATSQEDVTSKLCRAMSANDAQSGEITVDSCETQVTECVDSQTAFRAAFGDYERETNCEDRIVQRSFRATLLACPTGYTTADLSLCLEQIAEQNERANDSLSCSSSQYEIAAVLQPETPGSCKSLIDSCPAVADLIDIYQNDLLTAIVEAAERITEESTSESEPNATVASNEVEQTVEEADEDTETSLPATVEDTEDDLVDPVVAPEIVASTPSGSSGIELGMSRLASDGVEACKHLQRRLPTSYNDINRDSLICRSAVIPLLSQNSTVDTCTTEVSFCREILTDEERNLYPYFSSSYEDHCREISESEESLVYFRGLFQSCEDRISLDQLDSCLDSFTAHYENTATAYGCAASDDERTAYEMFSFPAACTEVIQSCTGMQEFLELYLMRPFQEDVTAG